MRRLCIALLLLFPSLTFMGCGEDYNEPEQEIPSQPDNSDEGDGEGDGNEDDNNPDNPESSGSGKILIAYFSRWGNTDYPADVDASTGASVQIRNGNKYGTTQIVAQYIQSGVGGAHNPHHQL